MKGYDEAMTGYAAGADTDIEDRLATSANVEHRGLPAGIIQDVIKHDDKERVRFHRQSGRIQLCRRPCSIAAPSWR